jgi:hypothetical protein
MNLVDWVPAVLARDLIILSALEQYAKLDPMRYALEREEIIVMVSYVYLVRLMHLICGNYIAD